MVNNAMFNPSIATYFIDRYGVRLELELSEESLESFSDLYPNSLRKVMGLKQSPLDKRSKLFLQNKLTINADGKKLFAQVVSMHGAKKIMRDVITGEILKQQPLDSPAQLFITIKYSFHNKLPKVLEFKHNTNATLAFILYHENQAVNNYAYLSKTQELHLNWSDSFYTYFTSNTLKRQFKYPAMGYLYIEPRMVRVETLMRYKDIERLSGSQKSIKSYFLKDNKLLINHKHLSPDIVNISYFEVSELGLKLTNNSKSIDKDLLFVGVSQQYYVDKLPSSVSSEWNYFNKYTSKILFNITDPVGPYPSFIYKETPLFEWKNLIKQTSEEFMTPVEVKTGLIVDLPLVGEKKLWSELPTKKQARQIIEKTLQNIRIAFIEKEPHRLSAELSKTLHSSNPSLQKELQKLFAPSVVRGGYGSVKEFGDFEIKRIDALNANNGFSINLRGEVNIIARHWGHDDNSILTYQVIIDFVERNNRWFIEDFSILDLKDKVL